MTKTFMILDFLHFNLFRIWILGLRILHDAHAEYYFFYSVIELFFAEQLIGQCIGVVNLSQCLDDGL